MSDTLMALPSDHPMVKAWNAFCETDEFKSALRWAMSSTYDDGRPISNIQREQHAKGAMWLAFTKGLDGGVEAATPKHATAHDYAALSERLVKYRWQDGNYSPNREEKATILTALEAAQQVEKMSKALSGLMWNMNNHLIREKCMRSAALANSIDEALSAIEATK